MVLTKGDDFPIHQTSEPIAYAGTDRNYYDRYFFNGYGMEGDLFFAVAFGVYPALGIADAAFCLVDDGVQTNIHASRWLGHGLERMDLRVGPISIEVIEPLQKLRVKVEAPEQGVRADVVFEGRAFPIEEPRFVRRNGSRVFMDYTRLTQNGTYSGWVERDGKRSSVDGFFGTRDRSWGIRPVGERDTQAPGAPPGAPQFFWIWSPTNFEEGSFFFHTNDDGEGEPWNRRAVWARQGANIDALHEIADSSIAIDWQSGTRHAKKAVVTLKEKSGTRTITFEPQYNFYMLGLGYGHPKWGHGRNNGELAVEREDLKLSEVNVQNPQHLHIQAISKVTYSHDGGAPLVGRGVLEQLVMGAHAPSGFKQILDMAP